MRAWVLRSSAATILDIVIAAYGVALPLIVITGGVSFALITIIHAVEGIGRYAAVLFPVVRLAATARSRMLHKGILIGGALLLALLNCLFVTRYPIS
jgi:hypothetical protein